METTETRWQRHVDQGRRYVSQGNYAEAEQSLLAAVKEALNLGPADLRVASSLGILGKLKHRQGDRERAQGFLERALAVREEALGPEHYGVVQGLNDLAALHYTYGNLAEARALYERALSIAERQLAPDHADLAQALYNLSRAHFKSGEHLRAEPLLTRLLEIKERTLGADHADIAAILTALSRVRSMAGRHDEAEAMARRALDIRERALASDDPAIAVSLELVAYFCAGRAKRMRSLADAERILGGGAHGAPVPDGSAVDSVDSGTLEVELAALAAEERALRERARGIRSRPGANREPNTLERSPAADAVSAPAEAAAQQPAEATVEAAAESAPGVETAVEAAVEAARETSSEAGGEAPAEAEPVALPDAEVEMTADAPAVVPAGVHEQAAGFASVLPADRSPGVEYDESPVTDAEYIPAVIVPRDDIADAPAPSEVKLALADSLPSKRRGRRIRWFLGVTAIALAGAGVAGFAIGRGSGAPESSSLAQVQQASRGALDARPDGTMGAGAGAYDASIPAGHDAAAAVRGGVPRIPDWNQNPPRARRQPRIPSRSHARRMTRTMEQLGDKVMVGVDSKLDSIGRAVELPPPTFGKP